MSKKRFYPSQRGGQQPAPPQTALPVMEPTTKDEAMFNLLLQRLEQIAVEQRLQAQMLATLRTEQEAERVATLREMATFKSNMESALGASIEAIQKFSTVTPLDEKTKQAIYNATLEEARKSAEHKRKTLLALLDTQPKGDVVHHFDHDLTFGINGIMCVLRAGVVNKNVPQAFIDEYHKWVDTNKASEKFEKKLRGRKSYGTLETLLTPGRVNDWRQYNIAYEGM